MYLVLGPVFLLLGMFLVGLITVTMGGTIMSEGMQKRVDAMGIWGALFLGILFAVSFCPTSAAWFFGLLALVMGSEAGAVDVLLDKVGITLPEAALPGDRPLDRDRDPYLEVLEQLWDKAPDWKKKDIAAQIRATVEEYQREQGVGAAGQRDDKAGGTGRRDDGGRVMDQREDDEGVTGHREDEGRDAE